MSTCWIVFIIVTSILALGFGSFLLWLFRRRLTPHPGNEAQRPPKTPISDAGFKRFFEPHHPVPGLNNLLWWCSRCNLTWWTTTDKEEQECPECGGEARCLGNFNGDEWSQRLLETLLWKRYP